MVKITILGAIEGLQEFLEEDLYTKFRPEEKIDDAIWVRKDSFKGKNDFYEYIHRHFNLLKEQIKEITETKEETN